MVSISKKSQNPLSFKSQSTDSHANHRSTNNQTINPNSAYGDVTKFGSTIQPTAFTIQSTLRCKQLWLDYSTDNHKQFNLNTQQNQFKHTSQQDTK